MVELVLQATNKHLEDQKELQGRCGGLSGRLPGAGEAEAGAEALYGRAALQLGGG